jgi:hypothetical protein
MILQRERTVKERKCRLVEGNTIRLTGMFN